MLEKHVGTGECRVCNRHALPENNAEARSRLHPRNSIMQYGEFGFLNFGLVLLGAAVLSVPIARRLGLSAIVAYLIAGIIIGPHGLAAFGTPESIIPISELGVVMLLFLIGLELEFGRLAILVEVPDLTRPRDRQGDRRVLEEPGQ